MSATTPRRLESGAIYPVRDRRCTGAHKRGLDILGKPLASKENEGDDPTEAMRIAPIAGFGTVNASLIALPDPSRPETAPVWRFAEGPPDGNSFDTIRI